MIHDYDQMLQEVAIKKMKSSKSREFFAELKVLCKVHHMNVVRECLILDYNGIRKCFIQFY